MAKKFLFLFLLYLLSPALAQGDYKNPSQVVVAYFQALKKFRFEEMPNYLYPELLEDIKQKIIYGLIEGQTDNIPSQLQGLSREEIEAMPNAEVASYMIPYTLDQLGGRFDTYKTVKPVWASEDGDRAYVVISYQSFSARDDESQIRMSLIPLKRFEGEWFLLNEGELIIITDYMNFNVYE